MKSQDSLQDERFQEYLSALDSLVGSSGRFVKIPSDEVPFWLVAYDGVPETGSVTAFTFGISSVCNSSWQLSVPELVISVDSTDDDWLLSLGAIASSLRGKCPFTLGNVLRYGKPMSQESEMSSFFLFWPTILEKEQQHLQLSDRKITFSQAYPIFDSEADAIAKIGAEKLFMMEGVDFADVSRGKVA